MKKSGSYHGVFRFVVTFFCFRQLKSNVTLLNYHSRSADPLSGAVYKEFPQGIPTGLGSGLAFAGKQTDGSLLFYSLTDRGPNGDAPLWLDGEKRHLLKYFWHHSSRRK